MNINLKIKSVARWIKRHLTMIAGIAAFISYVGYLCVAPRHVELVLLITSTALTLLSFRYRPKKET